MDGFLSPHGWEAEDSVTNRSNRAWRRWIVESTVCMCVYSTMRMQLAGSSVLAWSYTLH